MVKKHYPDAFCAAILNSQPMGFYAPAQLVRDAREHKVEVRHPDINNSDWDCTLEPAQAPDANGHAVRLGLRLISGAPETVTNQSWPSEVMAMATCRRCGCAVGPR